MLQAKEKSLVFAELILFLKFELVEMCRLGVTESQRGWNQMKDISIE